MALLGLEWNCRILLPPARTLQTSDRSRLFGPAVERLVFRAQTPGSNVGGVREH